MDESVEVWLGPYLLNKGWHLATAESCTGGLIGCRVTNVPGSSEYFERGFITYSDKAKMEILGIPEGLLIAHGAVSGPCARAMADGTRRVARCEVGLAVTGIAGPGGGTSEKPVGTVFMAVSLPSGTTSGRYHFEGCRKEVKKKTAESALNMLRDALLGGEVSSFV